jgi:hypothetical protein
MNQKTSIVLVVALLGAATSLRAEMTSTNQAEPAAKAAPQIFLVQRGAPKNFGSGLIYVDVAGHELSKSREYALEKAAANSAASEPRMTAKKTT